MALTAAHLEARRTTFPDESYERVVSYDPQGLILQRRNRAGRLVDHAYDGAGRLTLTSYSGAAADEPPIAYDYDGQGREIEIERDSAIANNDSRLTIAYDALGRRASETQDGREVEWQYDIAGRPTRLTWPDAFYVNYEHSPAAQLVAIEEANGAALVSFEYNINGWLNRIVRANGLETSYSFDPVGRMSRVNHIGQVYTDFTYNPASQIRTRALSNGNWAWDEGLNVDLDYDVNNLNQYESAGSTDFDYDLAGNLTEATTGAVTNGYAYDPENRMKWATGGTPAQLRYDGRGRLRRRWGSGSGTTDYLYDGDAMIAEYNDATGAVLRRYLHGAGVDDPLIWIEGAGTAASARRYLHADERGSITTVTNHTGGIIQRNRYDEWGNPGAGNIGRFQYTGQQWLPEIGLYYYKARFYAPGLGRFMQTDPLGYEDGMNLYAYVNNDSNNLQDSNGLDAIVTGNTINIVPNRQRNTPSVPIPRIPGARGFRYNSIGYHSYVVDNNFGDRDQNALSSAIAAVPAPASPSPATIQGTVNNIGLQNYVVSFLVPSPDPSRYTDIVVNYTLSCCHSLAEGFVMAYGVRSLDGSYILTHYGEGVNIMQSSLTEFIWGDRVEDVWTRVQRRISNRAQHSGAGAVNVGFSIVGNDVTGNRCHASRVAGHC